MDEILRDARALLARIHEAAQARYLPHPPPPPPFTKGPRHPSPCAVCDTNESLDRTQHLAAQLVLFLEGWPA